MQASARQVVNMMARIRIYPPDLRRPRASLLRRCSNTLFGNDGCNTGVHWHELCQSDRTASECAEAFGAGVTAASGASEAASASAVEGAGIAVLQLRKQHTNQERICLSVFASLCDGWSEPLLNRFLLRHTY